MFRLFVVFLTLSTSVLMAIPKDSASYPHAIFVTGCFWCSQPLFDQLPGVISAQVGYTGGHVPNPTYEQVSTGATGHRESIDVVYDPTRVTYDHLLETFWLAVDPSDAGGQFYDRGSQYKTAIYYFTDEQKKAAEASKVRVEKMFPGKKIAVEILPAKPFYKAESYHQQVYKKRPERYNQYKEGTGHDEKLKNIWGDTPFMGATRP